MNGVVGERNALSGVSERSERRGVGLGDPAREANLLLEETSKVETSCR